MAGRSDFVMDCANIDQVAFPRNLLSLQMRMKVH